MWPKMTFKCLQKRSKAKNLLYAKFTKSARECLTTVKWRKLRLVYGARTSFAPGNACHLMEIIILGHIISLKRPSSKNLQNMAKGGMTPKPKVPTIVTGCEPSSCTESMHHHSSCYTPLQLLSPPCHICSIFVEI